MRVQAVQRSAVKLQSAHCFSLYDFPKSSPPFRSQCGKSRGEGAGTRGGPRFSSVPQRAWYEDKKKPKTHNGLRILTPSHFSSVSVLLFVKCSKLDERRHNRCCTFLIQRKQLGWSRDSLQVWYFPPPENRDAVGACRELPRCCLRPVGVKIIYKRLNTEVNCGHTTHLKQNYYDRAACFQSLRFFSGPFFCHTRCFLIGYNNARNVCMYD